MRVAEEIVADGTDITRTVPTERQVSVLAAVAAPGDSGAPVVDEGGRVLGVLFALDLSRPTTAYALTDDELRQRGDGICPPASRVGTGRAETLVTGLGRQRFTANAFNDDGQQVETIKQGDQVTAVVRGFVRPEGLDALIPTCITGGQPPDGAHRARQQQQSAVGDQQVVGPPGAPHRADDPGQDRFRIGRRRAWG